MRVLITGGAGFIGSNLVKYLLQKEEVELVRVLDNYVTGKKSNIQEFHNDPKFELIEGDIRNIEDCKKAADSITHISHQAALGSVQRSIENPLLSNENNVNGWLNILQVARENQINKIVFASSSSVYGDDQNLPKIEEKIGQPLSPYALTKRTKEEYGRIFSELYDLSIIGLRYFNVFGPKQDPSGAYAAVIPIFIDKLRKEVTPTIHGDGLQSRDFTYIENVVNANYLALKKTYSKPTFRIFNIALGDKITVKSLYYKIAEILKSSIEPNYGPNRRGDIKNSLADISKIKTELDYKPLVSIEEGLKRTIKWHINNFKI